MFTRKLLIIAPAGKTNNVVAVVSATVVTAVWVTVEAPMLRMVPAVVPVVFLTVPSSQGPR